MLGCGRMHDREGTTAMKYRSKTPESHRRAQMGGLGDLMRPLWWAGVGFDQEARRALLNWSADRMSHDCFRIQMVFGCPSPPDRIPVQ